MKLLIVDDDTLIQKSLSVLLSHEDDITISGCASSGTEAFEMCKTQQPDAILMDIRMPGMDGIATTRLIKKEYPNIRIMIFTTFEDKPAIQQALAAGADGYMLKTDAVSGVVKKLRTLA